MFYSFFQLKTAREAVKFCAVGGIVGAVSTAGVAWKYSRSLHGMLNLIPRAIPTWPPILLSLLLIRCPMFEH